MQVTENSKSPFLLVVAETALVKRFYEVLESIIEFTDMLRLFSGLLFEVI